VSYILGLHWIIGLIIIASSYIFYARLGILSRRDLRDILSAFMSEKRVDKLYDRLRPIIDSIFH
ncbi:MAG: hypothetical protein DRO40_11930, partial [Thermoprotei archaeon]